MMGRSDLVVDAYNLQGNLTQKNYKFKDSLGYITRLSQKDKEFCLTQNYQDILLSQNAR
jgi:hypothetical protein